MKIIEGGSILYPMKDKEWASGDIPRDLIHPCLSSACCLAVSLLVLLLNSCYSVLGVYRLRFFLLPSHVPVFLAFSFVLLPPPPSLSALQ